MDIVPVLPAQSQLAQAQQPPSTMSWRRIPDSPAVGDLFTEPAARYDGETRLSHSEEVSGLDGVNFVFTLLIQPLLIRV
jgi:hypothetical protein